MHDLPIAEKHIQRVLYAVGIIGLFFGCRMAYNFGSEMSFEHGVFLVLVAILAAVILPVRELLARREGNGVATKIVTGLAVLFIGGEFFSHLGYTFGQRDGNVQKASIQQASFKGKGESVEEQKTQIKFWEDRVASLTKQNGWAASVTADALRAKMDSLNLAIQQEAARGGCKTKCLERTKERDEVASRIAILEERSDLSKKIEHARAVLDQKREVVAKADAGHSAVVAQTVAFAKLWTMSFKPGEDAQDAVKYAIGLFIAILATAVPPSALTIGYRMSARKEDEPTIAQPETVATTANDTGNPITINMTPDNDIWKALHSALNQPKRIAA